MCAMPVRWATAGLRNFPLRAPVMEFAESATAFGRFAALPPGSNRLRMQAPSDNSFDRRADFSAAHRARKSTQGCSEAPQAGYVGKTPVTPGALDPELANALGYGGDDPSRSIIGDLPARDEISDISEPRR